MIYTSGSTGHPKAVMNSHRGICNHLRWKLEHYGMTAGESFLQKTPFSFDVSLWELFVPLWLGARLVIARPDGHRDGAYLRRVAIAERLTNLHFVPSMLRAFLEESDLGGLENLRRVLCSGEALPDELQQEFHRRLREASGVSPELHNLYGPTEAAVEVSWWPCRDGDEVRIGRPVANTRLLVLDRRGRRVAIGVAGQLHLGGVQVGRGYFRKPAKTAEVFIPDAFGSRPGARLYATGDLAAWRADGSVAYLGRIDHQVKVRGSRIELGEIEVQLRRLPAVRDAVVRDHQEGGQTHLVAYLVLHSGAAVDESAWRAALVSSLPEYMVPGIFMTLEALPLTPSGKVDRRALPAPTWRPSAAGYAAPQGPVETLMAEVWSELLGVEGVGRHDSFFALGGHSLMATRLVARLRAAFGVEVPVQAVFETPRLADLAVLLEGLRGHSRALPPVEPVARDGELRLSFAQERLWFLDRLLPAKSVYNLPAPVALEGPLDPAALAASWRALFARHEALRTTFRSSADGPVQEIGPSAETALPLVDLSGLAAADQEARRLRDRDARRPFDLARGPLVRAALIRLAGDRHHLLVNQHHIVSDGWSIEVMWRDLSRFYRAAVEGRSAELPPLVLQPADFAAWQRRWLRGEVLEEQLDHWRDELAGAPALLELPTDRPRPAVQGYRGGVVRRALPGELADELARRARAEGATSFMLILAAVQVLLSRHGGGEDISLGSPTAGRRHVESEGLIGFFANTLVLRSRLGEARTFRDLLARVRRSVLEGFAHQDLPFEKLVEALQPERSLSHAPIFQVLFVLQRDDLALPDLPAVDAAVLPAPGEAKFDLTFVASTGGGRAGGDAFELLLEYDRDLFDATTVRRYLARWEVLLRALVESVDLPLADLPLLPPAERHQVAREWSDTAAVPEPRLLHEFFLEQAAARADRIALVEPRAGRGDAHLTYRELERRSAALAGELRRAGVTAETRVGLCASRSAAMVGAMLGILRAGGAYVALDPAYPPQRLALIVEDAGQDGSAPILLCEERHQGVLPALPPGSCLGLEAPAGAGEESAPPSRFSDPDQLAYILYTSGSTGRPKGVAISHRSASALVHWARRAYSDAELGGVLAATSISFDLSVFELFVPLAWGGTVILAENALALADRERMGGVASRIRLLNTVPSAAAELLRLEALPQGSLTVNLAGEPLRASLVRQLLASPGVGGVVDLYGPSEDTTYSTCGPRDLDSPESIGRAIDGSRVRLLDAALRPCPIGVLGELCLAGEGLARGYLLRPALTAERFVPEPGETAGARLYRTGDLARFLADGRIAFAGRIDHQVKVRGFRIELGEIEVHLQRLEAVSEAVVLVREEAAGARLEAHLVATEAVTGEALRDRLGAVLPAYMVPAAFWLWSELPRLPNGKIDRRTLAAPAGRATLLGGEGAGRRETAGERPVTPFDQLVIDLFGELLGVAAGVDTPFFSAGGHSLLGTQLISRLNARLGVELPLRTLFERPTPGALAAAVQEALRSGATSRRPPLVPAAHGGEGPLSFAQERLWFLDRLDPGSAAYNIPMAWRVRAGLDPAALEAAWNAILARHEALRTSFPKEIGEPTQRVRPPGRRRLPVIDLSALPEGARDRELRRIGREEGRRPFDLEGDDLLRMSLVRLAPAGEPAADVILANLHHIAGDGWSIGVWQRELDAFYDAALGRTAAERIAAPLPPLPVQYLDFAIWQRGWLQGEVLEREVAYWRRQLQGAPPLLELPTDRPRPAVQSDRGANVAGRLGEELGGLLQRRAAEIGATPFMLLLAAFKVLLQRHSDQSDLVVGSPIAGRTQLETEALIGFFLNNLVLRTDLEQLPGGRRASFAALVEKERQVLLEAYAHQDLPFEKLVEELQPERALSHTPIYQVMLNLHNWDGPAVAVPQLAGRPLEWMMLEEPVAKLDLNVHLEAEPGGAMLMDWTYNRDLFDATTVRRLSRQFARLLAAALADPGRSLDTLPLLDQTEISQTVVEWNDTARPPLEEERLHPLFEHSAERSPDALALVFGDSGLSYGQLERSSRLLARELQQRGVGPEVRVGLHLERSLELVVGVLGVLRAGGAYVPLDPELPAPRLAAMLADSRARAVVTRRRLAADLPPVDGSLLAVEDLDLAAPADPGELATGVTGENLAYVIYTSGTTGRPKGVMCRHQGASAYLRFMLETFTWRDGDRTLQLASLAFDPSVRELFGPLGAAAAIVLVAEGERRDPAALLRRLDEERITAMLSVVPSLLRTFPAAARAQGGSYRSLRTVMTNGEKLFVEDARLARRLFGPGLEIVNQYGPTECTMVATYHRLGDLESEVRPVVRIGRPVFDKRVHLLDARLEPVPIGVTGEICVAGRALSRGYLDRPALTARAFLPDPLDRAGGGRLYATGDLGRFLAGGRIEFIGRRDHQVKVRGNRVELGEIEAALRRHPAIRSAVVVAWEPQPQEVRLVAYLELEEGTEEPASEDLRAALRRRLPDYMVPSLWTSLERLPLNPNGKVDRKSLPDPSTLEVGGAGVHVAPRTSAERLLAAIWSELLGLERVGIEDNFFDLGGHSLHGIRSIYRLQELLGIDLETRALFEAQTVAELAPLVEEKLLEQVEALSEEEAWRLLEGPEPGMGLSDSAPRGEGAEEPPIREASLLPRELALRLARLGEVQHEVRSCRLRRALARSAAGQAIPRRADRERAPLSWIQEAFWFIEQQEDTRSVYRSNHRVTLHGRPSVPLLEHAIQAVVARHEILRTRFAVDEEGRTYQEIEPELEVELPVVDLQALDEEIRESEIERVLVSRSSAGFDLEKLPLFRLLLLQTRPEESVFLVAMHHIITDNWSMGTIFFQEIAAHFNAFEKGEEPFLPELSVQYADYAQWERDQLEGEAMDRLMAYWGERMAGGMPRLDLRTDRPRPATPSYRGAYTVFDLSPELSRALAERSRAEDASLYMTLLAVYKLLLHRWSDQVDLLVASPSANRSRIQTENLLGCFANMMLLRTDLSGDPTLREVLARVKETALGAFTHQEMPFMLLLANFPPAGFTFDRSPFQASFTFLNATGGTPQLEGLQVTAWEGVDRGATDQEWALWMEQKEECLSGTLVYDLDLFDPETIERVVDDYRRLAETMVEAPETRLSELARSKAPVRAVL